MKAWTQRQQRSGDTTSPASLNDELRSAASQIATLGRDELPIQCVSDANLVSGALMDTWASALWPGVSGSEGEQQAVRDSGVQTRMWEAVTFQASIGGWQDAGGAVTLSGFKGGQLFVEWSGNGYVNNLFADTTHTFGPGVPRYLNLRILIDGVLLVERRGTSYHDHWRIFGTAAFPPGDLTMQLQWRIDEPGPDDATVIASTSYHILQAHLYSMKYLAIGRWR